MISPGPARDRDSKKPRVGILTCSVGRRWSRRANVQCRASEFSSSRSMDDSKRRCFAHICTVLRTCGGLFPICGPALDGPGYSLAGLRPWGPPKNLFWTGPKSLLTSITCTIVYGLELFSLGFWYTGLPRWGNLGQGLRNCTVTETPQRGRINGWLAMGRQQFPWVAWTKCPGGATRKRRSRERGATSWAAICECLLSLRDPEHAELCRGQPAWRKRAK